MPIRTLADAEGFHFIGVDLGAGRNDDVVIWDLHESDERDRGAIFAELKAKPNSTNSEPSAHELVERPTPPFGCTTASVTDATLCRTE